MLEIKNLHARVADREILRGVDLTVARAKCTPSWGRTGPARARSPTCWPGGPATRSRKGTVTYKGRDLLAMSPEERAREGVFLAFQYPVEIAGVSNVYFLKAALNAMRKHRGLPELDAMDFLALVKEKAQAGGHRRVAREAAR